MTAAAFDRFPAGLRWRRHAACLDHRFPYQWFSSNPVDVTAARAVCAGCPVRVVCRDSQLDYERQIGHVEELMAGGCTPADRRVILEHRAAVEHRGTSDTGVDLRPEIPHTPHVKVVA